MIFPHITPTTLDDDTLLLVFDILASLPSPVALKAFHALSSVSHRFLRLSRASFSRQVVIKRPEHLPLLLGASFPICSLGNLSFTFSPDHGTPREALHSFHITLEIIKQATGLWRLSMAGVRKPQAVFAELQKKGERFRELVLHCRQHRVVVGGKESEEVQSRTMSVREVTHLASSLGGLKYLELVQATPCRTFRPHKDRTFLPRLHSIILRSCEVTADELAALVGLPFPPPPLGAESLPQPTLVSLHLDIDVVTESAMHSDFRNWSWTPSRPVIYPNSTEPIAELDASSLALLLQHVSSTLLHLTLEVPVTFDNSSDLLSAWITPAAPSALRTLHLASSAPLFRAPDLALLPPSLHTLTIECPVTYVPLGILSSSILLGRVLRGLRTLRVGTLERGFWTLDEITAARRQTKRFCVVGKERALEWQIRVGGTWSSDFCDG